MAIKVTRKDQGEANENIIRRFNRKVLQSGMMPLKKSQMRFAKPMSKRERRAKAIIREARKICLASREDSRETSKFSVKKLPKICPGVKRSANENEFIIMLAKKN